MSRVNCSSNCFFFVASISARLLFDAPLIDHLFLPEWDEWNMWIVCRALTNFSSSLQLNVLKDEYRRKKKFRTSWNKIYFATVTKYIFAFGATIRGVCLCICLCLRICVYQNCFFLWASILSPAQPIISWCRSSIQPLHPLCSPTSSWINCV